MKESTAGISVFNQQAIDEHAEFVDTYRHNVGSRKIIAGRTGRKKIPANF